MADEPKKARWYRGKVADMLRASGYIPISRLWVTPEQRDRIMEIAKESKNHVNSVRRYCRELEEEEAKRKAQEDAAWAVTKRSREDG